MVSEKTMAIILAYAVPIINENLSSLDFLNNHVQKIDGVLPFYDDQMWNMKLPKKGESTIEPKQKRSKIHLKDSWSVNVSAAGDKGYVYLDNSKRSADGRWKVADLIWYGTGPYQIFLPTVYQDVIVSAVPGVGQTQYPSLKQWRKYRAPEPILQGHHTGAMFFYNRYTNRYNYNRTARRGIRPVIVNSFKDYIILCVKSGIEKAIEMMTNENILKVKITSVSVKAV